MVSESSVAQAVSEVEGTFSAQLLQPGDAGYDDARRVHNGMVNKRPALIARCRGAADVVDAVKLARGLGLEVSIRGGGHNVAGRAVVEGGLMIDLAGMKGIHVDAGRRTVRSQGGATWADLDRETQLHGLAVTGGAVSTTGIAGLTLGGGIGWLMGKYGLALDNLQSVELVTAEGQVLRASAEENADLFWAVRGGGGNFGVVTSLEYRLFPVGPTVTGGLIAYSFDSARQMLRFYRDFTAAIPDEHSVAATLVHAPDGSGTKLAAMVCLPLWTTCRRRDGRAADQEVRFAGHGCARSDTVLPAQQHARRWLSKRCAELLEIELSHPVKRRCHRYDDRVFQPLSNADGTDAARALPRSGHSGRRNRHGISASAGGVQFPGRVADDGSLDFRPLHRVGARELRGDEAVRRAGPICELPG